MSRSTSPTFINSRRKSSLRMVSSGKQVLLHFGLNSSQPEVFQGRSPLSYRALPRWSNLSQSEPEELVRSHGEQIGQIADTRKNIASEHLYQNIAFVVPQVKLHRLR